MNRKKLAIKNSSISLFAHILTILLQFVTRSVFIKYLNIELLGLNSIFSSLLSTLSVAELGFQSAVVYNLYSPLAKKDIEAINKIISIYKIIYRAIGIFFIAASVCCIPFLPYIVKGIEVDNFIRCVFLIQATTSACTYFLAYKRCILYADQNLYITNLIDTAVNIAANILEIILLIRFQNYILYLLVKLIQTYVGNIIVHIVCAKKYPYLHNVGVDRNILKKILHQVKEIFSGKIAGYIYSSTDNLVISAFVGTIYVGLLNNYTIITNSIKTLVDSITGPIAPIIGNFLASNKKTGSQIFVFESYNYIRFILSGMMISPIIVLTNDFVKMWIGEKYILSTCILLLLAMDLYIHIMHSSCCDYLNGNGLFEYSRKVSVVGAVTNITTSIILVNLIGIAGVLVGTVISQFIFWITRSYGTYKYCFKTGISEYVVYWLKQMFYFVVFFSVCLIQKRVYLNMHISNDILRFVFGGIVCEIIFFGVTFIICLWMKEQKYMFSLAKKLIRRNTQ